MKLTVRRGAIEVRFPLTKGGARLRALADRIERDFGFVAWELRP